MDTLLNNIEKVIALTEERKEQLSNSPTMITIHKRYCSARDELKQDGKLKTGLSGGVRAYLNAFSDYEDNPLLNAMYLVEKSLKDNDFYNKQN